MKKYEMPEIELKLFVVEDIIATSTDLGDDGDACPTGNLSGWA